MPICNLFIELTGTRNSLLSSFYFPATIGFYTVGSMNGYRVVSRCALSANVQWWFLGVVRFLRFGWTQQSCRELDSVPCWQKRNPGREDDMEMKWFSHVSEHAGSERMRCKWWAPMFILNVHSIVSQAPLAPRSQSPKVCCLHNSTQTCGQLQGITPTVPQLLFLSFYGGSGPSGAGHR